MTDGMKADVISDAIRTVASWLIDRPAYFILGLVYEIFFNVASAELFSNSTVRNFYYRMQLIIGVFMIFKLAVTILQGIMSPERITDQKAGIGNIISRVIIALTMLVVLVPINIPNASNEYEVELNNNGLLFGTLYSLQNRILANNTLGRLILGTTDEASDVQTSNNRLAQSADIFTSTILKGFIRINLIPEEDQVAPPEGKGADTIKENWVCSDLPDDYINVYTRLDADPGDLFALVNHTCASTGSSGWFSKLTSAVQKLFGTSHYAFAYRPVIGGIVAFVFSFILISYTVDVAVRAVKLAVLRLIAPIPIISYMGPQGKDGGAFGAWVKALMTTYLDIFIRLAIIYFVIFLIQDMIVNGIVINQAGGFVGIFSFIFICLGLFIFAKQAPKFIKDVLGIKGGPSSVGLNAMLGGTAALIGGAGISGALAAGMNAGGAAMEAQAQGKQAPPAWRTGADLAAQIKTGDPKAKGGLFNNINDRLMRSAGINAAWKNYGVSKAGLDQEKNRVNNLESQAADAKDYYDRLVQGNLTSQEMDQLAMSGLITTDHNGNQVISDLARQRAYQRMNNSQAAASKARKDYDEIKKFADTHRITPSAEEKFRRSWKERLPGANNITNRPDFYDEDGSRGVIRNGFVARRTDHQRLVERTVDEHGNVHYGPGTVITGGKDGNRWRPGADSGAAGTSQYHDNPLTNVDTPGGGPPPGGGPGGPPPGGPH